MGKKRRIHPISDHALLRYIERVLGGNIKEMKDAILTEEIKTAIGLGASGITKDGFYYAIENGKVITVMKKKKLVNNT